MRSLVVVRILTSAISEIKGDLDRRLEGSMGIKVLPLFCSGLAHSHQVVFFLRLFELLGCDCIGWSNCTEVRFRGKQNNRHFLFDFADLGLPLGDVID